MNLVALVGTCLLAFAQSGAVPERAREILSDPGYQVELPGEAPPSAASRDGRARAPDEEHRSRPLSPAGSLTTVLAWGALVVCLALLVAWLAQMLGGYRGDAQLAPDAPPAPSPASVGARILADAEALAARGRYAEAIHVLLLRVFEALARGGTSLEASATSREILAQLELEPVQENALARLVERVERSLFGGHRPERSDYESCLRSFETFAAAQGLGRS